MQRPPKGLPLVPVTPLHEAINRINAKLAELANMRLGASEQASIRVFVERTFTQAVLGLSHAETSIDQIAATQEAPAPGLATLSGPELRIRRALASIEVVEQAVEHGAALTTDLLLKIHDPFLDDPARPGQCNDAPGAEGDQPAGAMVRVGAFCQWVDADSFKELNALEQSAIVVLRLLEIRPFEEGNIGSALGAGSLFTMRAGWPPIIIPEPLRKRFNPAVGEGLKMNTRPLIDLFAESIYDTLNSMIDFARTLASR